MCYKGKETSHCEIVHKLNYFDHDVCHKLMCYKGKETSHCEIVHKLMCREMNHSLCAVKLAIR